MRSRLVRAFAVAAVACAACGSDDDPGAASVAGFLDIASLDPSFEGYNGANSNNIFENGYILRILAAGAPVHSGAVSVRFQDVEQQEIRFPSHLHPTKIPLVPGGTYVVHVWLHGVDVGGAASVASVPVELSAVYYNGTSFVVASPSTTVTLSSFGSWQERTFVFIVPAGVDRAYIAIEATAGVPLNVDLFIDDVSIERRS